MGKLAVAFSALLLGTILTQFLGASLGTGDEVTWTKHSGNPLDLGVGVDVSQPWVIYDGQMFKMWYSVATDPFDYKICFAESLNGVDWSLYGVVLDTGEPGSWDDQWVCEPLVLFDGTTYRMWYIGHGSSESVWSKVGYATSSNGIDWAKHEANPVLVPGGNGGWDDWNIADISAIFAGTHFIMLYSAQASRDSPVVTGVATSLDGVSWTKYPGNPVLLPGPSEWDNRHVWAGPVIIDDGCYKIWYTGQGYSSPADRIGLATSTDGFTWSKCEGNPVLDVGQSGSWDSGTVYCSCLVRKGSSLLMWYNGQSYEPWGPRRIGFATSYAMAAVNLDPDTVNLNSNGKWITCYIELPEGYVVGDINVSSLMLNETILAEPEPVAIGDYDNDGVPDLIVKFDRAELISYILANVNMTELAEKRSMTITLAATGNLNDGTPFQGSKTIRIILPKPKHGNPTPLTG